MNQSLPNLIKRHRLALTWLLAGLLWLIAMATLYNLRQQTDKALVATRQALELAAGQAAEISALRRQAVPTQTDSLSLITLVEQNAKRQGIDRQLKRMVPKGKSELQVLLADAPFDQVVLWLGHMHYDAGVSVAFLRASAGSAPGLVDMEATLNR